MILYNQYLLRTIRFELSKTGTETFMEAVIIKLKSTARTSTIFLDDSYRY